MGSSGSGKISDYPGSASTGKSGGEGGGSDAGAEDRCEKAFSARLEDVEQSEYYRKYGKTPPIGTRVEVGMRKRPVAQTTGGESIGNLPTSFNYIASCMKEGWAYIGVVQSAKSGPPVASIQVDFAAIHP